MNNRCMKPLTCLDDLLEWTAISVDRKLVADNLEQWKQSEESTMQTLVCHDMGGGYLDTDKFADGCNVKDITPFYVTHWWYMDIFVYFSHNLVTIPPVGWTNIAHRHGVLVLGTFITEWELGASIWCKILATVKTRQKCATKLAQLAKVYNFDGWLVNIENEIQHDHLSHVGLFLTELSTALRQFIGAKSKLIWYDSVTFTSGRLRWQDELNALNNLECPSRLSAVFMGIDCFGRGTFGDGGWNCSQAFQLARKHCLSVALFAPGWLFEKCSNSHFHTNSIKFWSNLRRFVFARPIRQLPICTDFSTGFSIDSFDFETPCLRFKLSDQQLQPHFLEGNNGQILPNFGKDGCSMGIRVHFRENKPIRLFLTDIPLDYPLKVSVDVTDSSIYQLVIWIRTNDQQSERFIIDFSVESKLNKKTFLIDSTASSTLTAVGFISDHSMTITLMSIEFVEQ